MEHKEVDVKAVVDKMEKSDDGCRLLFDEAFQLLNKDFKGQMSIIDKIEQEAKSRENNRLSFEHVNEKGTDPKSKHEFAFEGVNIRTKEGKTIFQELLTTDVTANKVLGVQKTCKPASNAG